MPPETLRTSPLGHYTAERAQGLKELSELVKSYQGLRENEQRGPATGTPTIP